MSADTIGAQFTVACTKALARHKGDVKSAWDEVGANFGIAFLLRLSGQNAYNPRTSSPERRKRREGLGAMLRSKYKNSSGVAWSDVSWTELRCLSRDGAEAKALLEDAPAFVPNDGRTVGQVLGIARVDEIIEEIRRETARCSQ